MNYFVELVATTLILLALVITCGALSGTRPRRRRGHHRPGGWSGPL